MDEVCHIEQEFITCSLFGTFVKQFEKQYGLAQICLLKADVHTLLNYKRPY